MYYIIFTKIYPITNILLSHWAVPEYRHVCGFSFIAVIRLTQQGHSGWCGSDREETVISPVADVTAGNRPSLYVYQGKLFKLLLSINLLFFYLDYNCFVKTYVYVFF